MALLRHFTSTGDSDVLALWQEWETATCGRKQMTWSRGLRSRLQLLASEHDDGLAAVADDGTEPTDEEIAGSQDRGDKQILILDAQTWRRVRSSDLLWRLLETAEDEPALLSGLSDDNPWGKVA